MDTTDPRVMSRLIAATCDYIDVYKIGLEAYTAMGPAAVRIIRDAGKEVFLDLKYHDIPNQVAGAVRAGAELGAFMMTLHTGGGRPMLAAARSGLDRWRAETGRPEPFLLGVTILTSLSHDDLNEIGFAPRPLPDTVADLASLAGDCGLHGVVASPLEIALLRRKLGPGRLIVTPGIRPSGVHLNDQKRTLSPGEALAAGADFIVVGRPITAAPNPREAAAAVYNELSIPNEGRSCL